MSNEKKYTAEEVARKLLAATHNLLKKSELMKANTAHEIEEGLEPNNDDAEAPEYLANADIEGDGEKKKKKKAGIGENDDDDDDVSEMADEDGDGDVDGDDALKMADKDDDGDIDGDDAIEGKEDEVGEDLDEDEEEEDPEAPAKKIIKDVTEQPDAKKFKKPLPKNKPASEFQKKEDIQACKCNKAIMHKKQGVPKGANPQVHEKCVKDVKAQGKSKKSAYKICNAVGAGMDKNEKGINKLKNFIAKQENIDAIKKEKNKKIEKMLGVKPKMKPQEQQQMPAQTGMKGY